MKRISLEETKKHFSTDEDYTDAPIRFYSVIKDKDGWDKVTYYTNRRKDIYKNRGKADQWVYVLSNPSHSHYKIGYTKNEPEVRAKQISTSTGVALPYKVEFAFQCFNGEALEHEVHRKLEYCRVNQNREFFDITLSEAKEAIVDLGKNYI
jgi:hypothetical protein